jgi:undecaprenyl-diphosphatase
MNKRLTVFIAEYGVVGLGALFLLSSLQGGSLYNVLSRATTGGVLLIFSLMVTYVFKKIIKKERPPQKEDLFNPSGRYAFPSGHATGLTTISLYILSVSSFLGLLAALFSFIVMKARVDAKVHDVTDMAGGIIVGALAIFLLHRFVESIVAPYLLSVYF